MRFVQSTVVLTALLAIAPPISDARLIESWSYTRLFKEADLVVIAEAEETKDTQETLREGLFAEHLVGQTTRFSVRSTLKGKAGETIKVLHFRLRGDWELENGPLLVRFLKEKLPPKGKEIKGSESRREYLLFLKRCEDGRFEPVSGQVDSRLSARVVDLAVEHE